VTGCFFGVARLGVVQTLHPCPAIAPSVGLNAKVQKVGMMTRFSVALLFAICSPSIALAGATITSADTGYSVAFPVQPKKGLTTDKGVNLVLYLVRDGDNIFASQEGFYPEIKDVQAELETDLANFVKQLDAEITSRQNADFITTAGTTLPARRFSFEGTKFAGKGIAVASGRCTCIIMVAATSVKPNGKNALNEKFLSSFKIDR
jgi:hypothetical protein